MPLSFRASSSFGFPIAHSCFSFSELPVTCLTKLQAIVRSGSCLNLCTPLPGPHSSFGRFLTQREFREHCPRPSQISIHNDFPMVVNTAFLQHIQFCVRSPGHVNVFHWNWNVFFFFRQLNSRFTMMAINEVALNRSGVIAGFCVILCFVYLRVSLQFFFEIFTPCRLSPPHSGFSDSMISFKQFCCSICDREYKMFTPFGR